MHRDATTCLALATFALATAAITVATPGAARAEGDADRARALELNAEAVALFERGDAPGALLRLRQAIGLAPGDAQLRLNASRVLVALGDGHRAARRLVDAARDYHEAAGLAPDEPDAALREGLALHEDLRDRDAVAVLEALVRRWDANALGHELLARSLYRLGENARAIDHWRRVVTLDPAAAEGARAAIERASREEQVERAMAVDLGAPHFSIKVDGQTDAALGRRVGRALEDAWAEVGQLLGRWPPGEVAVVIYPRESFRAVTGSHGWVAGLYDGKIRLPAGGLQEASDAELRRVVTHEVAHAFIRAVGGPKVPAWLHEGLAQVAEGRARAAARAELAGATVPAIAGLGASFAGERDPAAARVRYAAACDLVFDLMSQGGTPLIVDLLERLARGDDLDAASRAVYGRSLAEVESGWRAALPR